MDCLTKAEAEERFRFTEEDSKFCPECLSELRLVKGTEDDPYYYCPNEMCLSEEQYDMGGSFLNQNNY